MQPDAVDAGRTARVALDDDAQEVTDYCARPLCRAEFRRQVGRGRRQSYCSEVCRRTSERELRQLRSRLAHFEAVVDQLRIDVAAFGRADTEDSVPDSRDMRRRAERAVARAGGVVAFVRASDDALAIELCALHDAVAPTIDLDAAMADL